MGTIRYSTAEKVRDPKLHGFRLYFLSSGTIYNHRVAENQYGVLVHEFTHAYTHNWDPKEIYNPMEAVKLSATRSLKNPSNFALYAASEYFPL